MYSRPRSSRPSMTASVVGRLGSDITVIDTNHPLYGQRLRLLALTSTRGPEFLTVCLADGRRRPLRRSATDLDAPAPGRAELPRISVRTLLPLARLVRGMLATSQEEAPHAAHAHTRLPLPHAAPAPGTALAGAPGPGAGASGAVAVPADPASAPAKGGQTC